MLLRTFLILGLALRGVSLLLSFHTQDRKWSFRCNPQRTTQQVRTPRFIDSLYAQNEGEKSGRLVSRLLSSHRKRTTAGDAPLEPSISSRGGITAWESMTVPELKTLLKSKNLKVSGTKKELLYRIESNKTIFADTARTKCYNRGGEPLLEGA